MPSKSIVNCRVCGFAEPEPVFFAGWLPSVNAVQPIGLPPAAQEFYPAEMHHCPKCGLVQLGCEVESSDRDFLSGTTKTLRDNFADLARECVELGFVKSNCNERVVDIGSNDGSLLGCFQCQGCDVLGIEPGPSAEVSRGRGITTWKAYFDRNTARQIASQVGRAKVVTACNVLAHVPDPNAVVRGVLDVLADDGVFTIETHYLPDMVAHVEYDTLYHLYYLSLASLKFLLEKHGLRIVRAKRIPTHGGSIRVYAKRTAEAPDDYALGDDTVRDDEWEIFRRRAAKSKRVLWNYLSAMKYNGAQVFGVGAPSRAVTLAHYVGLDENLIDCIVEVEGSAKIGKCLPGTLIPIVNEKRLFDEQPEYALLFSWHIAGELIPKLREKGFRGQFVVPLPEPKVIV